jgi:oligoendopeptidase F
MKMSFVQAAQGDDKPNYKTRAEIPEKYRWKLEDLYTESKNWEADLNEVNRLVKDFVSNQGKLSNSATALKKTLDEYSRMMRLAEKVYVYAKLGFDVNMGNSQWQERLDLSNNMMTKIGTECAWLEPEIAGIPNHSIRKYLEDEGIKPYKQFLEEINRTKAHTLSKDMEELLALSSPIAQTPEGVFEMLSKDIALPNIKDGQGKSVALTPANYVSFMTSDDRNVRKRAFAAYYKTLGDFQDSFAQTLAGEVKAHNFYAKARKYDNAMEASLNPNDIPTEVYNQLLQTVNKHLPLLHRYMKLRKKLLGVDELHMYDLNNSLVKVQSRYIPFEEAKGIVLDALKPLGMDYVQVLKQGFENRWIDVYSTKDKKSGGYQLSAYGTHPYVLLNYQGTKDDVYTVAHEMGHAMQSYLTNEKQPFISSGYPIFTAEVASTMNETLLFKSLYGNAKTKAEKLYLLNKYLDNFRATLFRQTQFAEFEQKVHEMDQAGIPLTGEALKRVYLDINKKYYGPAVVSDPEISMEWARIPHFYNYFYVYQYATSFAASTALASQILHEGKPALDRIKTYFLQAGSSMPPLEELKAAGVDMSTPKPIEDALKVFEDTLKEFEKQLAQ